MESSSVKYWLREIAGVVFAALAIFLVLQFTIMKAEVIGASMEPNLHTGEQVIVNKMAYNFGTPDRGDIIVFMPPAVTGSTKNYIKRVIGLPGEQVSIEDGQVFITRTDGTKFTLDEPYIAEIPLYDYESNIIPPDNYFVMGDNRNNSSDSRGNWFVTLDSIVGKAWFSFWPLSDFGMVPNYNLPE